MKITFYGAAQGVTGSKHLIEVGDFKLLLDCGMHQGKRSEANALNKELPFDAASIDAVILSHAHADHCGSLPLLVKNGFEGKIYCTQATADIAKFILEDTASIQQQDAEYFNNHLPEGQEAIEPIYDGVDVKKAFSHFSPVPYFRLSGQWTKIDEQIKFKFYDAGHILGSAVTVVEIAEDGTTKRLVFTGDLGRDFLPILRAPEFVQEEAETIIMEATYGARLHRPVSDTEGELIAIVNEALQKKSKIIVPAFSLGRTQELLYILHKLINENKIPSIPIFVDSPLAQKITRVFSTYTADFDEEFWKDFGEKGERAFIFDGLTTTQSVQESQQINAMEGPLMVIAGSGMCEGGRILHHLKNGIENPNNIIVITGYQGENTLGRKIVEGMSPVRIFGREYQLKAGVRVLNELSAHADQKGLLDYVEHIKGLEKIFLVHTEMNQAEPFKELAMQQNPSLSVEIPSMGQSFEV